MNMDRRKWLMVALGIIFLANVAFFFTYRVRYEERVESLNRSLTDAESQLQRTRERRQKAEDSLAGLRRVDQDIARVYDQHWSTPQQRLTRLLIELRRMETRSQLIPQSTSFALTEGKKDYGTTEMGISFSVRGNYTRIRQLINLIELSPHFVVIDSINLSDSSEADSDSLTLSLNLKTLFKGEQQEEEAGKRS
jgi:Tfp pilus assembly protein PilO